MGSSSTSSCPICRSSEIEYDGAQGNSVCIRCGAVVEENTVVSELTFNELANGSSVLEGQFIAADRGKAALPTIFGRRVAVLGDGKNAGESTVGESREITLANGRRRIQALAGAVGLAGEHYIDAAHRWYALALQHQFTRGRRGPSVIAACMYIVCRQERTPHMLLDFADVLCTSVYQLGGTFLRLVRLLNLEIPLVDPSFYVARFAARLEFGEKTAAVANSALRLVARMKRDWIQTGRRPAGICAAGLTIAARMHGFRRTEAEVVRVVRICEATLRKRLEEFGRTPSSQLTLEEFEGIWLEQEADPPSYTHTRPKPADPGTIHILPSQYMANLLAHSQAQTPLSIKSAEFAMATQQQQQDESLPLTPPDSQRDFEDQETVPNLAKEFDDEEIDSMLLNEDEVNVKTRLWTELHRDYLEKEAEKERLRQAAEAQLAKANESAIAAPQSSSAADADSSRNEEIVGSIEVSCLSPTEEKSVAAANSAKAPRTTRAKRAKTEKASSSMAKSATGAPVAATAAEAAKQVLQSKRFSKKINYEALDELFTASASSATIVRG